MNLFHTDYEMRMVLNINTLIAAYRFAQELNKTSYGKNLYEAFWSFKKNFSERTWSIYRDVIDTCKFSHYYSFGIAYKKIEDSQSENSSAYFKDVFMELKNCNDLHIFIENCDNIARDLEQSYLELTKNLPIMNQEGITHSFELYRAWLDLFYNIHNTKVFYYLHSKIGKERLKDKSIQEYFKQRDVYPFSSRNRRLIRRLGRSNRDQRDMWFLEFFESTRRNVAQLIFETHFGLQLEINKEETLKYRENEVDIMRTYKIKINGLWGLSRGDFLILSEDGELQDIGIVQRKSVINILEEENALSILTGLFYPRTDQELFFYDLIKKVD